MRGGNNSRTTAGVLRCALLLIFLLPKSLVAWTITSIDGHDYVPFSEITQFYDFTIVNVKPHTISMVKPNKILLATLGSKEIFLNNLRFYLNFKVVDQGGSLMLSRLDLAKVIDPVLRPGRIKGAPVRTVILDPGHGGTDQGTWSFYGTEKAYTLDMANRIGPILRSRGLEVILTRDRDEYVGLEERVQIANRHRDAVFVSLHFNAGTLAGGIETYALTPVGVASSDNKPQLTDYQPCAGNLLDPENIALATSVHGCIMQQIHLRDRGIRRARFHVLKGIEIPGVLVEGGYLGGEDAFSIAHVAYRQVLAECIANGIARYMAAVPALPEPTVMASASPIRSPSALPKTASLVQSGSVADVPVTP